MESNPYSAPAGSTPEVPDGFGTRVSSEAVAQLATTKPWVRFISVITFIGAGFMMLAAAGMIMFSSVSGKLGDRGVPAGFTGSIGITLAIVYICMAIVHIFPALKLWKYADAIGSLIQSGSEQDLAAALKQQKSFWKFMGILILSVLVIYILIIVVAIGFAGFAAALAK